MSMEYYAQRIVDGLEPHDGTSIARGLEDEVEQRKLQAEYCHALHQIVCREEHVDNLHEDEKVYWWLLIRATPEQRAAAFLKVINP